MSAGGPAQRVTRCCERSRRVLSAAPDNIKMRVERWKVSLFFVVNNMFDINKEERYMVEALKQARQAAKDDEVPVGAVIVHKDIIIARAHNQVETLADPTAHAEMIAITQATSFLHNKWLSECTIYVTIEPCSMCAGALILARIGKIVYGANDDKTGACGSVLNIANDKKLNHRPRVKKGVLARDCAFLLSEFFKKKRIKK